MNSILCFLSNMQKKSKWNVDLLIQLFILPSLFSEWQIWKGKWKRRDKGKKNIHTAVARLEMKIFCRNNNLKGFAREANTL